jgi:hypothetical protein
MRRLSQNCGVIPAEALAHRDERRDEITPEYQKREDDGHQRLTGNESGRQERSRVLGSYLLFLGSVSASQSNVQEIADDAADEDR